jgi:hypothetical protein
MEWGRHVRNIIQRINCVLFPPCYDYKKEPKTANFSGWGSSLEGQVNFIQWLLNPFYVQAPCWVLWIHSGKATEPSIYFLPLFFPLLTSTKRLNRNPPKPITGVNETGLLWNSRLVNLYHSGFVLCWMALLSNGVGSISLSSGARIVLDWAIFLDPLIAEANTVVVGQGHPSPSW